jgi:imidazolonepropionase-like amidohydrolase
VSGLLVAGGTVFDAVSGDVIRDGVVRIEGDRIAAVGRAATVERGGRDVPVLDATGRFVLPGLMDCHVHLLAPATPDYATRGLKELVPYTVLRGAVNARRMLEAGFTTVRDVGANGYGNIALRQAVAEGLRPGRASWPPATRSACPAGTATRISVPRSASSGTAWSTAPTRPAGRSASS